MMETKIIGLCSDHAGFAMKEYVKSLLVEGFALQRISEPIRPIVATIPTFAKSMAAAMEAEWYLSRNSRLRYRQRHRYDAQQTSDIRAAICWENEICRLARLPCNDANIPGPSRTFRFQWSPHPRCSTPFEHAFRRRPSQTTRSHHYPSLRIDTSGSFVDISVSRGLWSVFYRLLAQCRIQIRHRNNQRRSNETESAFRMNNPGFFIFYSCSVNLHRGNNAARWNQQVSI